MVVRSGGWSGGCERLSGGPMSVCDRVRDAMELGVGDFEYGC